MKGGGIQDQTLEKYNYKKDKPSFSSTNYTVYNGVNKQTNIPVTIKILKYPHVELGKYLKQIKDLKSQYVVRIFQLVAQQTILILVTQQVRFGNLKKALTKPQRLDQNDAIFIGKILLSGHAELLRSDVNWFGTEEDIEFTDTGVKLSWNNGCSFNLVNPFPIIINKLYNRVQIVSAQNTSILPFPPSKTINQLAKISKQNASEISMSPQMKKKEKISKKKGKDWLGLKQYKNKNQYFDEFTYFAVSDQLGFIRVKIFDQGKVSPNLVALNKTKQYFTKIIDIRQQGSKTTIISQYANDGHLQSYVTKLKANGITLKEDQIQFFIYSLFTPIKLVQQSSLMSINMLHIRNIYIENGIPKIGQPIPINQRISQVLMDRSDVPDFYHSSFKRDPQSRNPIYDTYSLGVLLYKLMYTQYPIFPNQKVHIPTTPAYNKRLKTTLQIFLNEGGTLKDIEQRIDVSDAVKKQVQQNQVKLMQGFQKKQVKQKLIVQNQDQQESEKPPTVVSNSEQEDQAQEQQQEEQDYNGPTLYELIAKKLQLRPPQKTKEGQLYNFVDNLESSSFKHFRLWSKTVLVFCLYVFVFFYKFLQNIVNLVASQNLLTGVQVNISNVNYTIITTDKFNFQLVYNVTAKNLQSLEDMHCLYQKYQSGSSGVYTSFINDSSGIWIGYIMGGFAAFIIIMIIKAIQIHNFDQIKSLYKKYNGVSHFNMLNWFLFNLFWLNLLTSCYFLFNFIFYPQTQPCVGFSGGNIYGSTNALFNNHLQFTGLYVVIFLLQIFAIVCYLCVLASNDNFSPGYNFILNPISVFGSILFIFFLIIRFGVILGDQYYPAAATDSQEIIKNIFEGMDSLGIFAFLPEILFLIQIVILIGVDFIYYGIVDKNKSLLGNQTSNINQSLKELI